MGVGVRRAETEFGDAFDLREFHDRVVAFGNITLPMLEEIGVDYVQGFLIATPVPLSSIL